MSKLTVQQKVIPDRKKIRITFVSRKHVQLCAQLPIGSRQTTGQRLPLPLDVCQRLGLIWSGRRPIQAVCEGGVEELVAPDYRLGFKFSEVEGQGRNNNDRAMKR